MHKGHNHVAPKTNGASEVAGRSALPIRTTSEFTTGSVDESNGASSDRPEPTPTPASAGVWGSYDGAAHESYISQGDTTIGGDGFGGPGGDGPPANPTSRSFGGGRTTGGGVEETVTITLLPEKEGMFMFQHHNYQVASIRRGSKVVRRYSDFVWLLDCLQKRFPFRQIPLLPPKRVGGKVSRHLELGFTNRISQWKSFSC